MRSNGDLTVYNARYNADLGYDEYKRTTIYDVHWYSQMLNSVGTAGLKSAEIFTVRIPNGATPEYNKEYKSPREYKVLDLDDVEGYYTFQPGDKIVRGATDFEVTGSVGHTWADIEKNFDEVFTVTGYADNRQGSTPHIKVVGS